MRLLSARRAFGVVSTVMALVSSCRVVVLYLESVSAVRAERMADAELLAACAARVAVGSAKMREACLQAQADRAAPVLFKGVVRAVSIAWGEFADSCTSLPRLLLAVTFAFGVLAQPGVSWLRVLQSHRQHRRPLWVSNANCSARDEDADSDSSEDEQRNGHYIVFDHSASRHPGAVGPSFKGRLRAVLPRLLTLGQTSHATAGREIESQKYVTAPDWQTVPLGLSSKVHSE